jgi:tetratricopeptide (TPR) repeat protein
MKSLRSLTLTLVSLASLNAMSYVSAQLPTAPKTKIDLKVETDDASVKLDPTGKLPVADKADALVPLDNALAPQEHELPAVLKKLSPDQLAKYAKVRDEATDFMRSVRLQESLEKLSEAERIAGDSVAELENLRGAIYTKMRDFPNARLHFEKSVSLDKNAFHPNFNLAELDFVQKKYSSAIKAFTHLLAENDTLKKAAMAQVKEDLKSAVERQFLSTDSLINFKLFICQTLEKNQAAADSIFKSFNSYDNDSPAYYFAKSVQAFAAEKKEVGEEWIASAKNIYPASITEVYVDSMVEMGWMTTLTQ